MSEVHEGGCHCRAIRWRIEGPIQHASYCHCRMCQLSMGAVAGAFATVASADFRYTAGTPKIYRSSDSVSREFCGNCGAQVVFRREGKERHGVNLVTFDDPSVVAPTLHIWTESRIPWFDTTDSHERRLKNLP